MGEGEEETNGDFVATVRLVVIHYHSFPKRPLNGHCVDDGSELV